MRNTRELLNAHPSAGARIDAVAACIEACADCEQACRICADACLAEEMVADLRRCIRTDLDCADICSAAGRVLSRQTATTDAIVRRQLEALRVAVRTCAEECEKHAEMHDHCRVCAETCRRCEEACEALLGEPTTA